MNYKEIGGLHTNLGVITEILILKGDIGIDYNTPNHIFKFSACSQLKYKNIKMKNRMETQNRTNISKSCCRS